MSKDDFIGSLHLIPSPIGENDKQFLAPLTLDVLNGITTIVSERIRTTRRLISAVLPEKRIDDITFYELDKHEPLKHFEAIIQSLKNGESMALLSEAGLPCVADPGYRLVHLAHGIGATIIPYPGPSSIFQALMASGFSGQNFHFHGYLSRDKAELGKQIKQLQNEALKGGTQIFMETPYRNDPLFKMLLQKLEPEISLCVAVNINTTEQWIKTKDIKTWRLESQCNFHKQPAVYLLSAERSGNFGRLLRQKK